MSITRILVIIGVVLALLTGLYYGVYNSGRDAANADTAAASANVVEAASNQNDEAVSNVIRETKIIEKNTNTVKEVIREVPETGINPISAARLDVVRGLQGSNVSETNRLADAATPPVPR